jgi:hypothetical protein
LDAHSLSCDEKRVINARLHAFSAEIALVLIDVHGGADLRYGPLRTIGDAGSARYRTSGLIQKKFGFGFNALRIVTPLTAKRAAFKKNSCSYTGAIMDSISLDIEDHSFGHLGSSDSASDAAWL